MILKISHKINNCGWSKQLIIDFDNKTVKKGAFLFGFGGDLDNLTATQYKQLIDYCKYNDFKIMEE